MAPFWSSLLGRSYSTLIHWYQQTQAGHWKLGVTSQIRLVSALTLVVVYNSFISSLSSEWFRVRFSKLWIAWFCYAALLFWAFVFFTSLLIFPLWPTEIAVPYPARIECFQTTWLARHVLGVANQVRLVAVLLAIGIPVPNVVFVRMGSSQR